jgi:uncharacterized protein
MEAREMNVEHLTDTQLETLSGILKSFGGKNAMNVEQIDGFLAALTCSPVHVPPREYLSMIWGDGMINEDAFAWQPLLRDFLSLVARHEVAISSTLQSGDVFTPLLLADENGEYLGNDRANGFMRGMSLCKSGLDRSFGRQRPCRISCQSLPWHTSMIPIPRCVRTKSP